MLKQSQFMQDCLSFESLLLGEDAKALETLISLHAPPEPRILDCTYSIGRIWEDCCYEPDFRSDIRELDGLDFIGDFFKLPLADGCFDVVVFDPPHLPNAAASEGSSLMWEHRYGITVDERRAGDNVEGLFLPFLSEARRVLREDGIILAKLADLVHNHRYQWQQVSFVNACWQVGLVPCDMLIKQSGNAGNLKSSKWQNRYHLRKSHCYWIVVRNSDGCEPQGMALNEAGLIPMQQMEMAWCA